MECHRLCLGLAEGSFVARVQTLHSARRLGVLGLVRRPPQSRGPDRSFERKRG